METTTPKCNYCETMCIQPHCHNCKMMKQLQGATRLPREIEDSLEEMIAKIESNENDYAVGDWKKIPTLLGDVVIYLLEKNHDFMDDEEQTLTFTFGVLSFPAMQRMNPTDTNAGGWKDSYMRKFLQNVLNLLPLVLQEHIVPVKKTTSIGQRSYEIDATEDKLWCFSEVEVFGTSRYSASGEGEQYDFFKSPVNRQRFTGYYYTWLRSPITGYSSGFCGVSSDGSAYYNLADFSYGVSFGFCIASRI